MKFRKANSLIILLAITKMSMAQDNKILYQSDAYTLYGNRVVQGKYTAKAVSAKELESNYESPAGSSKSSTVKTASSWKLSKDITAFPQYHSDFVLPDALYNLAIEEMHNAVEPDSTFRTGKEWGGVWTRDISYSIILSMAVLQPKVAVYSLMRKVKNNRVIQDTGTGGAYPVSSDRMIWAVAAWEVYKVTGDHDWLTKAYEIVKNSVEDDVKNVYDTKTGLVRGESSFLDWREQTYPKWMQPADIYESECLGTNAVHYQVNVVLAEMASVLNDKSSTEKYKKQAEKIKIGIQQYLWQPEKKYYGQYLYGRNFKILSPRSEALGEALMVVFNVADVANQKTILQNTPVNQFGIPCIYPQIPEIPPYHNNAVWPFVQSFWAMAAAKAGDENSLVQSMSAVYRPAAMFLTNKENFVSSNGDFAGTQINSSNMLWSLSGNISLVYKVLFGMNYQANQLEFKPFVPEVYAGKRSITNFKYRKAVLNIEMEGFGNQIKEFRLDGKIMPNPMIPAELEGQHQITIKLADNRLLPEKINQSPDYISLPAPTVKLSAGNLSWNQVVGATSYKILKNGVKNSITPKLNMAVSSAIYAEYQVVAIDAKGIESFASEPLQVIPAGSEQQIQLETVAPKSALSYRGFSGEGFVNLSKTENTSITINIPVKEAGVYALDFRYANGNGPINTENKCAIRTLTHQGDFLGTFVFPQRGKDNWSDWGFSNTLQLKLEKGTYSVTLQFQPANENMNGEINQAAINYLRIIRISQ
ncbi:MAG: MGH1-like glycoside hydrolase domain-containing protein [Janthinobacterium lividum]